MQYIRAFGLLAYNQYNTFHKITKYGYFLS